MKILIVDDSKFNLINARDMILNNDIDCEIIMCKSGIEAIEIINKQKIDIVLLDIVMPEMSGLEVLEELQEKNKKRNIIFIMYTSLVDKQYLKKSFELGASDFINKPIEPIEFVARLKSAIKMKEYYNALLESFNKIIESNNKLKETNIELHKTQQELINKEKLASIGRFSAGIAHEINTPLGYIYSNVSMLEKYSNSLIKGMENYRKFIDKSVGLFFNNTQILDDINNIKENEKSLKLDYIIDDCTPLISETKEGLTRISKVVNNIIKFSYSNPDEDFGLNKFSEIIEESLIILQSEFEKLNDIVNIKVSLEPEDFIICNRIQMEQVIMNIIENAVYFTEIQNKADKGNILIKTYIKDSFFYCDISDDGPGIREEFLDKIFDPFFTAKETGEGIGLGLSICYDIVVTKHKGDISVKSEVGKGTTVVIKLPYNIST